MKILSWQNKLKTKKPTEYVYNSKQYTKRMAYVNNSVFQMQMNPP